MELRQTGFVLYMGVDALIPARGKSVAGLDEFTAALDHDGIPAVWLTNRTRLEFDAPRRKLAHTHPFIAEGGCGVFLPTGYFHTNTEQTIRLGRFLCVAVAKEQPAAAEALEDLSEETGVEVVPLRSLSPRELSQNTGLPQREAELVRQRDFDELFFFAGASEKDIERFSAAAREKKYELRQHGVMWSLAMGASVKKCVKVLTKLYDRSLRYHPTILGVATEEDGAELFPACDRTVVLEEKRREVGTRRDLGGDEADGSESESDLVATNEAAPHEVATFEAAAHQVVPRGGGRVKHLAMRDPELWPQLLEMVAPEVKDSYK